MPDIGLGQICHSAVGSGPGHQKVSVGRPFLYSETRLRAFELKRDLETPKLDERHREDTTSQRETEDKAVAAAPELDAVVQREARNRAAQSPLQGQRVTAIGIRREPGHMRLFADPP